MQNMTYILLRPFVVSNKGSTSKRGWRFSLLHWFLLPCNVTLLDFQIENLWYDFSFLHSTFLTFCEGRDSIFWTFNVGNDRDPDTPAQYPFESQLSAYFILTVFFLYKLSYWFRLANFTFTFHYIDCIFSISLNSML